METTKEQAVPTTVNNLQTRQPEAGKLVAQSTPPSIPAIEFSNVSRHYRLHHEPKLTLQDRVVNFFKKNSTYEDFWALQDVSFRLEKGKTLGIIGPNGAGKSTLLKLATRILEPTSGVIRVQGRVSAMLELGTGFHPELSARENIYLNGAFYGFNRKDMDERYEEIVEFSELGRFIDTPVKHFSSGMYMRLGFAVAITVSPDILIIDEVLAVGDAAFARKCHRAIEDLKMQSKAMLFVSHSAGEISRLCDEVIYLSKGQVIAYGKPGDVLDEYMMASMGPSYFTSRPTAPEGEKEVESPLENREAKPEDRPQSARPDGVKIQNHLSPKGEKSPAPEGVKIQNQPDVGVSLDAAFAALETAQQYPWLRRVAPGINQLATTWQFSLPQSRSTERPGKEKNGGGTVSRLRSFRPAGNSKEREPERNKFYFLAILNTNFKTFDLELTGYKQSGGVLDQAVGALRVVPMGRFEIGSEKLLLLKLEEGALLNTNLLKLSSPLPVAAELIEYELPSKLAPEEPASTATLSATPSSYWFFPFCDIRAESQCQFEVFNPNDEPVELTLSLYRDWITPMPHFQKYQCAPQSQLTISLNEELAGGLGERHEGEGFYGSVLLEADQPLVIRRQTLQLNFPDYHLTGENKKVSSS